MDALRLITSIYYTERRIRPSTTVLEMADYNECSVKQVESVRELIKSIETERNSN